MSNITLTKKEAHLMALLATMGFFIPNGNFCYYFFTDFAVTKSALSNPISLVFIIEAFFLMFLFAWLLKKSAIKTPAGWFSSSCPWWGAWLSVFPSPSI